MNGHSKSASKTASKSAARPNKRSANTRERFDWVGINIRSIAHPRMLRAAGALGKTAGDYATDVILEHTRKVSTDLTGDPDRLYKAA